MVLHRPVETTAFIRRVDPPYADVPTFSTGDSSRTARTMRVLWCWRCKAEMPMLDDDEFKLVSSLFNTGTEGDTTERMFGPALHEYERITGFRETNPNAL